MFWQHRAWESGVLFFLFNFSNWDHIIIIDEFIAFSSEYCTRANFVHRRSNFRDGLILIYALELPTSRFCLCPIRLHYVATLTWLLGKLGLNASFHRELPPSFASIQGYNWKFSYLTQMLLSRNESTWKQGIIKCEKN